MNEELYQSRPTKLLVVDDNPVVSFFLEQTLNNAGYQVVRATNGSEALDKLADGSVDLILSDIMMPIMDGWQLCKQVRHDPELNTLPFIILSAANDEAEMTRFYSLGVDDYLIKPCQTELLLAVIRSHVERARAKQAEVDLKLDRFRRRIINTLSHEFRTPLMAINSGAEVLLNRREIEDLHETKSLVKAIQRGGERLELLVNDFMSLQQIEAGVALRVYRDHLTDIVLDELLLGLQCCISSRYYTEQIEYTLVNRSPGVKIEICQSQILDALMRLVDNSLKFSPQKGPIDVVFRVDNDWSFLSVCDRGLGFLAFVGNKGTISPIKMRTKDVTDAFSQLNRDILEQQGGGLGLAIARGYAEIHGGEVLIENRDGGGSVVSLKLPVSAPKTL